MALAKKPLSPTDWFAQLGWQVADFQQQAWQAVARGEEGLVNAPTGSGKTYSLLLPLLADCQPKEGLQIIWISPIRALAKEIQQSAERAIAGMGLALRVEIRTGDSSSATRQKQKKNMPHLLITTPESLHLLLASKDYPRLFEHLRGLVADEWHELLDSKRAVLLELALTRLRSLSTRLLVWGISATIGNIEQALTVLLGPAHCAARAGKIRIIRAALRKKILLQSLMPAEVESLPWAGHLGIKMLEQVLPIIEASESSLIFCNTRAQAEIWYQQLLEKAPELAGRMAMHHGSISRELRFWVEEALYAGQLKAVVCTSSLDLGVDFRPVDSIIQVGSPKGVARFMQRAGRSGHQPGATSRIYFVPTHSLELVEAAALRQAMAEEKLEERQPYFRSFDVLVQYLITLAVSEGFEAESLYREVRSSFSFQDLRAEEWAWCLDFICHGGPSLSGYEDFHKVERDEQGIYRVLRRRVAMRHRMSIGTIVSDAVLKVKFQSGAYLGSIEEYFLSRLKPGDVFWFAGRSLELIRVRQMEATVRKSKSKKGQVPSWQGGRMPLSAQMGAMLRQKLEQSFKGERQDPELALIAPLWDTQSQRSAIPQSHQLLIESYQSKEGHHLFIYPFEGRFVHEGMAALLAYRFSLLQKMSLSLAMNDYGFELLSDQPLPLQEALDSDLFSSQDLREDILQSVNAVELARRRFRDIAAISGLIFKGFPGQAIKDKHLQSSSHLLFEVLSEHEPDNLLLRQAYDEALEFQLEEGRLRQALERIAEQEILVRQLEKPSPFCFPIMVDRLREGMSNETLAERVRKMQLRWQ